MQSLGHGATPSNFIHVTLHSQWMKTKSIRELERELCVFHLLNALISGYYAKDTHHHCSNTVPYRLHEKNRCLK